jgi:hypothetical protein
MSTYQESPLLYIHLSLWYFMKERLGGSVVPGADVPCHFSLCNYHHSTAHLVQQLLLRTTNYMISIKHEKWDLGWLSLTSAGNRFFNVLSLSLSRLIKRKLLRHKILLLNFMPLNSKRLLT